MKKKQFFDQENETASMQTLWLSLIEVHSGRMVFSVVTSSFKPVLVVKLLSIELTTKTKITVHTVLFEQNSSLEYFK